MDTLNQMKENEFCLSAELYASTLMHFTVSKLLLDGWRDPTTFPRDSTPQALNVRM